LTMKTLTFTVSVQHGKCQFTDRHMSSIGAFLSALEGRAVSVTFSRPKSARSLKQNAYLWAVVYTSIAEHTGMSTEDVHDWCKDEFLPRRFVTLAGREKEIRKTTADLSSREFGEYLDRITAWAAQELGVTVPEAA
jgi:hypothetical protein